MSSLKELSMTYKGYWNMDRYVTENYLAFFTKSWEVHHSLYARFSAKRALGISLLEKIPCSVSLYYLSYFIWYSRAKTEKIFKKLTASYSMCNLLLIYWLFKWEGVNAPHYHNTTNRNCLACWNNQLNFTSQSVNAFSCKFGTIEGI